MSSAIRGKNKLSTKNHNGSPCIYSASNQAPLNATEYSPSSFHFEEPVAGDVPNAPTGRSKKDALRRFIQGALQSSRMWGIEGERFSPCQFSHGQNFTTQVARRSSLTASSSLAALNEPRSSFETYPSPSETSDRPHPRNVHPAQSVVLISRLDMALQPPCPR